MSYGRRTIEVCSSASIDEFDDDVILEAALGILERHRALAPPDRGAAASRASRIYDLWFEKETLMQRIAALLGVEMRPDLPPPSTAAQIKSMAELKTVVEKSPLFYLREPSRAEGLDPGRDRRA